MIVVYCAVAAVAVWCLAKAMIGPAVRLERVERARAEFTRIADALIGDDELSTEHKILLGYMADNLANPDLPHDVLAEVLSGRFHSQLKSPSVLPRDLIAAHERLACIRPSMAARVDKATWAFIRASTGQAPVVGGLCRFFLLRNRRIDLAVPGLVSAYEAARQAPARRISQELTAA